MKKINSIKVLLVLLLISKVSFCQTIGSLQDSIIVGQDSACGITYTKLNPILSLPPTNPFKNWASDSIDLNNDGKFDITLVHDDPNPWTLGSKAEGSYVLGGDSTYIIVSPIDTTVADSLLINNVVDSNRIWSPKAILYSKYWSLLDSAGQGQVKGYWINGKSYYIGIKLIKNNIVYYAWVKVGIKSISAYGITEVCIPEVYTNIITIYPCPTSDFITIETNSKDTAALSLFDMRGKEVFQTTVSQKTAIDLRGYVRGMYILSVQMQDQMVRKKIMLVY